MQSVKGVGIWAQTCAGHEASKQDGDAERCSSYLSFACTLPVAHAGPHLWAHTTHTYAPTRRCSWGEGEAHAWILYMTIAKSFTRADWPAHSPSSITLPLLKPNQLAHLSVSGLPFTSRNCNQQTTHGKWMYGWHRCMKLCSCCDVVNQCSAHALTMIACLLSSSICRLKPWQNDFACKPFLGCYLCKDSGWPSA